MNRSSLRAQSVLKEMSALSDDDAPQTKLWRLYELELALSFSQLWQLSELDLALSFS
jgi:hypothetical protein